MTKMHFEAAAQMVKATENRDNAAIMGEAFVRLFGRFSPRFDVSRFLIACGLTKQREEA